MRRSMSMAILVALVLAGCAQSNATPPAQVEEPAIIEPVAGQANLNRITLTNRAAERLGIMTVEVVPASRAAGSTQIPYSAVIYDAAGAAWAYVVEGTPNVFVRQALTVKEIVTDAAGDYAVVTSGPEAGASVVSVGVAELFGAEFDVGH